MLELFVLGAVQGLVEWIPLSSEGMVFLVKSNFFDNGESAAQVLSLSLFLHLGTFLAALIYFRKEIISVFKTAAKYRQAGEADKRLMLFLVTTTLVSGSLGYALSKIFESTSSSFENFGKFVTAFVAITLFVTGILILKAKKQKDGFRHESDIKAKDGLILGIVQGLAVLPGLSRSGLTVSTLLFRKFDDVSAVRLSFLMSMPIIFLGNIILNFDKSFITWPSFVGIATSFIVGLVTINLFFKLIKKINFGYFAIVFSVLMTISILIK
jgi:undecaprenyl-diphosphatase